MTKVSKSKEPLISVIVPIYNVEKYLKKCVDSIINQTYKNLEIILVDDGSPDNCPKICDEYKRKDKRIKVIHKENGGLSDARNAGIDIASGEYLSFVDSDDYIESKYIEILYNLLKDNDADMSMCKHYVIYPSKTIDTSTNDFLILNPHDCLEKMLYGEDIDISACFKLFKKKLFDGIRFPKGRHFEDTATTYKLIDKCKKIVFHSVPIYYYYMRDNSITNDEFNLKKLELITSTEEMTNFVSKKHNDLGKACDRRMMYAYLSTLTQLAKSKRYDNNSKEFLMNYISKNRRKVLKDKRIPKRDRIALHSLAGGYTSFKIFWNIYSKATGRKK